ncbi:hypothetical protein BT96DRAFT_869491, partial [Gymnopus androsaceus JB14]
MSEPASSRIESPLRIPYPVTKASWIIMIAGSLERLSFFGGSIVFQNYIGNPAPISPQDPPGRLGLAQLRATAIVQTFTFLAYIFPVFAAILSDQYFGKWRLVFSSAVLGVCGWAIVAATSIESLPKTASLAGVAVSMFIVASASGGVASIVPAFAADQVPTESVKVLDKDKKQVLMDHDLGTQHVFHLYYLGINVAAVAGTIGTPFLEKYISYWSVFTFSAASILGASLFFGIFRGTFIHSPPTKNLIPDCYRCIKAALRNRRRFKDEGRPAKHHFLDSAPIAVSLSSSPAEEERTQTADGSLPIPPGEFSQDFVDDLKRALHTCLIFPPLVVFWLAFNQTTHNLITQASTMRRPHWLNNDLMSNFNPITLIFLVPVMDSWVFPWLRQKGRMPSPIKRMTIGFGLVTLAMVWATILQKAIYLSPPHFDHPGNLPNNVSIWWQVGPYIIIALSEIFTLVAAIEYAYNHAPKSMKAVVSSLNALPNALASLVVYALLPASKDPNLVVLYGIISALSGVGTIGFYVFYRERD